MRHEPITILHRLAELWKLYVEQMEDEGWAEDSRLRFEQMMEAATCLLDPGWAERPDRFVTRHIREGVDRAIQDIEPAW